MKAMREITVWEFAVLCRSDPELYAQTVAIPKTITPEKIFDLAARNGYRLLPEGREPEAAVPLDDAALDRVSGGAGGAEQEAGWRTLHTWMYYVMGFGENE